MFAGHKKGRRWYAGLFRVWQSSATTTLGVCHLCTSRPRPILLGVHRTTSGRVAESLCLAPHSCATVNPPYHTPVQKMTASRRRGATRSGRALGRAIRCPGRWQVANDRHIQRTVATQWMRRQAAFHGARRARGVNCGKRRSVGTASVALAAELVLQAALSGSQDSAARPTGPTCIEANRDGPGFVGIERAMW